MNEIDTKTVTLSDKDIALLDSYVESGEYASREEALRDAVSALKAQHENGDVFDILGEEETQRWLREDVQPVVDRMNAGEPTLSLDEVRASLREHARRRSRGAA